MFNQKHQFMRSALRLSALFCFVQITSFFLIQNFLRHPSKTTIYWDPQLPAPPQITPDYNALKIYIPTGFLLFLLMAWRIAREEKEQAHRRIQSDFPYFIQLAQKKNLSEFLQWWNQRLDLSSREKHLLLSFLHHSDYSFYCEVIPLLNLNSKMQKRLLKLDKLI